MNKGGRYEPERDRKKPNRDRDNYLDFYPRYDYDYYDPMYAPRDSRYYEVTRVRLFNS